VGGQQTTDPVVVQAPSPSVTVVPAATLAVLDFQNFNRPNASILYCRAAREREKETERVFEGVLGCKGKGHL